MSREIEIRFLRPEDIDRVLEIAAAVKHAPHWSRLEYETSLGGDPLRFAQAARTADGTLAGFVVASLVPPESEIEFIAVAPEYQRRGIGRALLTAAMEELRRRGVTQVLLEVRESNVSAQAMYRNAGFVETRRRSGYYSDPVEDAILLQLQI